MNEKNEPRLESLREEEFAEQEMDRGRRVHRHDGVLWATVAGSYSRPVFEFRRLRPGEARPARRFSLLGYSHQVPEDRFATRTLGFMTLEAGALRAFGMPGLRTEKRAQVRKGLRECVIRDITDLDSEIEAIKAVSISQSTRQMKTGRFDRPPTYYVEQEKAWRTSVEKCFGRKGWRWIGAYVEERLVAYLTLLAVEDHAFFMAVKSHTDNLRLCPNDALYFTALESLREAAWCRRVVNGGAAHDSLNRFKNQFGFSLVSVPYYSPHAGLVRFAKRAWAIADSARRYVTRRSEGDRGAAGASRADAGRRLYGNAEGQERPLG